MTTCGPNSCGCPGPWFSCCGDPARAGWIGRGVVILESHDELGSILKPGWFP